MSSEHKKRKEKKQTNVDDLRRAEKRRLEKSSGVE